MKPEKLKKVFSVLVYVAGVACVVVLSVGYFQHSMEVVNPDAMLPVTEYERCVILLLFGTPFLLGACLLLVMTFSGWPIRWKAAAFLPLLFTVSLVGWDIAAELTIPEVPTPRFVVEVRLDADCDIYCVSGTLLLDGEAVGGQTCCEADGTPLSRKESITLEVVPQDVPEGHQPEELTLVISLGTESGYEAEQSVAGGAVPVTGWEESVSVTITGNAEEGLQAQNNL